MSFQNLQLIAPILRALDKAGYTQPTVIQEKAIPHVLQGKDVFGCAQTGTGKTAAFALPMLQMLHDSNAGARKGIKALILAPTRELALQIDESFGDYGQNLTLKHAVIFGGVSQHNQTSALKKGVDILVATPGRLLDLMNQGFVDLRTVEIFVLDEADRMLDMGFIHDIRKITAKLPAKRQTLFFSATVPAEIKKLADGLLHQPVSVSATPVSTAAETVQQYLYYAEKGDKPHLLRALLKDPEIDHVLVFTRTKHGADKVAKLLKRSGVNAEAIHGNKSQNNRQRALSGFKDRTIRVLVATDIASRGIDVDGLSHVINFDLPEVPETYVHRIGRTGRAGASGVAISFCASDEKDSLRDITRLLKRNIEVRETPELDRSTPAGETRPEREERGQRQGGRGRQAQQNSEERQGRGGRGRQRSQQARQGESSERSQQQPKQERKQKSSKGEGARPRSEQRNGKPQQNTRGKSHAAPQGQQQQNGQPRKKKNSRRNKGKRRHEGSNEAPQAQHNHQSQNKSKPNDKQSIGQRLASLFGLGN